VTLWDIRRAVADRAARIVERVAPIDNDLRQRAFLAATLAIEERRDPEAAVRKVVGKA
jgi:hypothetical protein